MERMVNVHAAKTNLSRLLADVQAGQEIILAKAGKPVARLIPIQPQPRKLGFVKGHVTAAFFDPLPEDEISLWE